MSDELRQLRIGKKLAAKDIVSVVQRFYPSFDKTMLSKSENGEKYGVAIRRDAMDALIDEFAPKDKAAIKRRRAGGHRLTCRISARLENDDFELLQRLIRSDGFNTTQDWLSQTVKDYINTHKLKGAFNAND